MNVRHFPSLAQPAGAGCRWPALAVLALLLAGPAASGESRRRDLLGDPLPDGALARLGTIRLRSDGGISCVAFSPDSTKLFSAGYSNQITTWSAATGRPIGTFTINLASVYSLQVVADGKMLALTGSDAGLHFIDVETGVEKKTLQDPQRRYGNITAVVSPDGKTALTCRRYDRQILVWDVPTAAVRCRIITGTTGFAAPPLAFTPDSKQFVTLWSDNKLHVVDATTGKSVRCLEPTVVTSESTYTSRVPLLTLTPDGKHVVFRTSADRFCSVIETGSGKLIRRIEKPDTPRFASTGTLAVTPSGKFLVEAAGEPGVRVWELGSGKLFRELTVAAGAVTHVALSPDSKLLAAPAGHCIYLWDLASGRQLHGTTGHASAVVGLTFTPDGQQVVSYDQTTMKVHDAGGRERHSLAPTSFYAATALRMSADGKTVWYVGGDKVLYAWRPGVDVAPVARTRPHSTPYYTSQTPSADGKWLAGLHSSDRKLRLIDLQAGSERELAVVEHAYGNQIAFSPDGRTLALSSPDRTVVLYDTLGGHELRRLAPETPVVGLQTTPRVVFSKDSRALLVHDLDLRVIETATGAQRLRLPRELVGSAGPVVWSDDGRLVAWGRTDGGVLVFDTFTSRELLRQNGEQGAIQSLAFRHDGRRLASGGANTTILVWDVPPVPRASFAAVSENVWRDLADADGVRSFRAVTHLVASPAEAVALLRSRFRPRPPVDARRIDKLVVELDDESYTVRDRASEDLASAGRLAESALRKAARSPAPEVKRRAEELLHRLEVGLSLPPDRLRAWRAVEVLEKIGSPAARELLQSLLDRTKTPLDPLLETAVKASLARMSGRG